MLLQLYTVEGNMTVHHNPSNNWDILLKTTNVNLMVVLQEKSEDHQSQ